MSLIIDKQTLDDLNIFGKRDNDSVYSIFNRTHTRGGAEILEQLFRYPLSDVGSINHRSSIIRFFKGMQTVFPFKGELFDAAEQYLANTDERSKLSHSENTLGRKFNNLIGADTEFQLVAKGIAAVIEILVRLKDFAKEMGASAAGTAYATDLQEINRLLTIPDLKTMFGEKIPVKLDYAKAVEYDKLLRYVHRERIKKLL